MATPSTFRAFGVIGNLPMFQPLHQDLLKHGLEGSPLGGKHAAHLLEQGGAQENCDPLPRP